MRVRLVHVSLLVCAAMWGLVFVGVHELLPVLTPVQLVTVRFVIIVLAFVAMFIIFPKLRVFPASRGDWVRFAVCGVLAVPGSQLAIVEGQRYLAPQLASLVVATSPVLTAVFAAAMLNEQFGVMRGVGSVIALSGVAFIVLFGAGDGHGIGPLTVTLPAVVAVLTPISWALYTVMSRPLAARYPPLATVAICLTLGTLTLLPFLPSTLGALSGVNGLEWGWLLYLALGGSLLPYLIWFASLRVLSAGRTAAYMYVIPLFAMIFTWLILGTRPGVVATIGGALVLIGVVLTQIRLRRPVAERAAPTLSQVEDP
jgi:drug/metabolite transporter (DMT)-like permease